MTRTLTPTTTSRTTTPTPPVEVPPASWYLRIDDLPAGHWREAFGDDDVLRSEGLHRAAERSALPGVRPHYLSMTWQGRPVVVPCFEYRAPLTLLAPKSLQRCEARLGAALGGLTGVPLFVLGSPLAICGELLGLRALASGQRVQALRAVMRHAQARARSCGARLLVVKELPEQLLPQAEEAWAAAGVTFWESLPTTHVALSGDGETYEQRLRAKYRVLLRRRLRDFDGAGLRWEVETDPGRRALDLHRLYAEVWSRSHHRFEQLTPDFFRQVSRELGDRAFCLVCLRGDRLVAFELFLRDDRWLHPLYLGVDYSVRGASLYFACLYRILREVEDRGYPVVQLGQTSYEAKAALGAVPSRLFLGVHHPNPLVRRTLRLVGPLLFPPTQVPTRHPFRDRAGNEALLVLGGVRPPERTRHYGREEER